MSQLFTRELIDEAIKNGEKLIPEHLRKIGNYPALSAIKATHGDEIIIFYRLYDVNIDYYLTEKKVMMWVYEPFHRGMYPVIPSKVNNPKLNLPSAKFVVKLLITDKQIEEAEKVMAYYGISYHEVV